jgi:hypothetical protein
MYSYCYVYVFLLSCTSYVPFWVFCFIVLFCVLFVCTVLLPPGGYPIAVNKYISINSPRCPLNRRVGGNGRPSGRSGKGEKSICILPEIEPRTVGLLHRTSVIILTKVSKLYLTFKNGASFI